MFNVCDMALWGWHVTYWRMISTYPVNLFLPLANLYLFTSEQLVFINMKENKNWQE